MTSDRVYLDYAATTPTDPRVVEAMLPYFHTTFGNPSSVHGWGQEAEAALETSRARLARILGCSPAEIVITSGGSESDNLALRGVAFAERERRGADHLLISPVEHDAVARTAQDLAAVHGFHVEWLRVDAYGRVSVGDVRRHLRPETALVSVIHANNEIGTVNPIRDLASACREKGVPFHTDAVQGASQLSIRVEDLGVDLLSIGAHKFYGPKGVGALFVRKGLRLVPAQTGGSHEQGRRAGTPNVPLIVGMACAMEIVAAERELHAAHFSGLRDRILHEVPQRIAGTRITGHPSERLPNHASFVFQGLDGNALLAGLDLAGYAVSSGSACKTGDPKPSEVLLALGLPAEWALGSLRVTVGRPTTEGDVEGFLQVLPSIVERLRKVTA